MMASVAPAIVALARVVLGVLLLAHGLVHLLFLAPDVPVFSLKHSWLVPASIRTQVAYALLVATIGAFALLALAVWGVPGLSAAWPVLALVAAALSTVLLVLFLELAASARHSHQRRPHCRRHRPADWRNRHLQLTPHQAADRPIRALRRLAYGASHSQRHERV
jgi:sterol desaturase/sphingolipid hydroxylase (fatty acid hydroxylase superfamily)